ncbi:hypothetical protein M446_0576 [Methylobacterium sp. 4-46]|uniref:hypothetical protein n=1 Tax=unclassified Methylobacterium TaxID=2615210 RepID=UPI000152D9DB|nr:MULTISPECIES: hypothetical protein [Methylobacterium]ACA15138.1 hypothetical protein M446_0576 [Methylobacterium sp. 4-46]WFT80871.1 hypothetical protein QA634_02920 [Methylobacterium nodulans]
MTHSFETKTARQEARSAAPEQDSLPAPVVLTPEELDAAVGGVLATGGLSNTLSGLRNPTSTMGVIIGPLGPLGALGGLQAR